MVWDLKQLEHRILIMQRICQLYSPLNISGKDVRKLPLPNYYATQ